MTPDIFFVALAAFVIMGVVLIITLILFIRSIEEVEPALDSIQLELFH